MGEKCGIGDGKGARGETKFVLKAFNLMQVIANRNTPQYGKLSYEMKPGSNYRILVMAQ